MVQIKLVVQLLMQFYSSTEGASGYNLVFVDSTQGWVVTDDRKTQMLVNRSIYTSCGDRNGTTADLWKF